MPARFRLLWADDEIDLLRPHVLYLRERGYDVVGVPSGEDALTLVADEPFDLILLDERMPGLDGLAVLERLRAIRPDLPVVMITKQEDEELMEEALGRATSDFLTKPVNPSQVLSVCKRILEGRRIIEQTVTRDYTQEFARLSARLAGTPAPSDWGEIAEAAAWWGVRLDETGQEGLADSLTSLHQEADGVLARAVIDSYPDWVADRRPWQERMRATLECSMADASPGEIPPLPSSPDGHPPLVSDLLAGVVFPTLSARGRAVLLVLDCMRYDQWLMLEPLLAGAGAVERGWSLSLVPTATPFARNALLSGRFPDEVAHAFPDLWEGEWDTAPGGLNRHEPALLQEALAACVGPLPGAELAAFERVVAPGDAEALVRRMSSGLRSGLTVIVVNFLDLLAHGQAESEVLQELAPDASAFRAIARQWFERSPLLGMVRRLVEEGVAVTIASDHGSQRVQRPVEVKADRSATRGLRFKVGRNLNADSRWTQRIDDLGSWRLPPFDLTTTCLVAREDAFLLFAAQAAPLRRRFAGSFQHGGLSLAELVVPYARIRAR